MTRDTDTFLCPRRQELAAPFGPGIPERDWWRKDFGDARTCSWCGSLHPDDFMYHARLGVEIGPTDKAYKVYVGDGQKFYFQHLSAEQRRQFVDLYNDRSLREYDETGTFAIVRAGTSALAIGYPGYFYVSPFFMKPVSA